MPFGTMFGLSKLAAEYGIGTLGVRLDDKDEIWRLPTPFVAPVRCGAWVTVIKTDQNSDIVTYLSNGHPETASSALLKASWNGTALLVKPDSASTVTSVKQ
ncbi:MAG: cysteine peptidase family C39 domain-containing protein [Bacteroidales bacterium]|nr:cysteine peptidase family C39 domain-containing protein [Bacteroidales bacterium]